MTLHFDERTTACVTCTPPRMDGKPPTFGALERGPDAQLRAELDHSVGLGADLPGEQIALQHEELQVDYGEDLGLELAPEISSSDEKAED